MFARFICLFWPNFWVAWLNLWVACCRRCLSLGANMKRMFTLITTPQFGVHGGRTTSGVTGAANKRSETAIAQVLPELKQLKLLLILWRPILLAKSRLKVSVFYWTSSCCFLLSKISRHALISMIFHFPNNQTFTILCSLLLICI